MREAMYELSFRKVYFIVDGPRSEKSNEAVEVEKTLKEMKDFKNIEEISALKPLTARQNVA
jgi:hypothetical protein